MWAIEVNVAIFPFEIIGKSMQRERGLPTDQQRLCHQGLERDYYMLPQQPPSRPAIHAMSDALQPAACDILLGQLCGIPSLLQPGRIDDQPLRELSL